MADGREKLLEQIESLSPAERALFEEEFGIVKAKQSQGYFDTDVLTSPSEWVGAGGRVASQLSEIPGQLAGRFREGVENLRGKPLTPFMPYEAAGAGAVSAAKGLGNLLTDPQGTIQEALPSKEQMLKGGRLGTALGAGMGAFKATKSPIAAGLATAGTAIGYDALTELAGATPPRTPEERSRQIQEELVLGPGLPAAAKAGGLALNKVRDLYRWAVPNAKRTALMKASEPGALAAELTSPRGVTAKEAQKARGFHGVERTLEKYKVTQGLGKVDEFDAGSYRRVFDNGLRKANQALDDVYKERQSIIAQADKAAKGDRITVRDLNIRPLNEKIKSLKAGTSRLVDAEAMEQVKNFELSTLSRSPMTAERMEQALSNVYQKLRQARVYDRTVKAKGGVDPSVAAQLEAQVGVYEELADIYHGALEKFAQKHLGADYSPSKFRKLGLEYGDLRQYSDFLIDFDDAMAAKTARPHGGSSLPPAANPRAQVGGAFFSIPEPQFLKLRHMHKETQEALTERATALGEFDELLGMRTGRPGSLKYVPLTKTLRGNKIDFGKLGRHPGLPLAGAIGSAVRGPAVPGRAVPIMGPRERRR